jgi:signal transduction histidine kinase
VFCVASAIVAAGFAEGFGFATRTALAAVVAVAIPYHLDRGVNAEVQRTVQGGGVLVMIGVLAGYARRLFGEAELRSALAQQANDLLTQLNALAQTLPASLDLDETLSATIGQLRELFPIDVVAVLLREDATDLWSIVASAGARLPVVLDDAALPQPVRAALAESRGVLAEAQAGLSPDVGSAIYVPLLARSNLIGLIAIENRATASLGQRELQLSEALAGQAALAIDNARWFSRLRTVGADEERSRIARDLHDRVGQSLAFVSFELDRISRQSTAQPVGAELIQLREEIRRVVIEVRETLYDLRTDVSERKDLVTILAEFADRVSDRTGVDVQFNFLADRRLPLRKEREIWRIAQEAVANAYRHGHPTRIDVAWRCNEHGGLLEVRDDGSGLPADATSRPDTYGILGMRERASAIGARIEFLSPPAGGTAVRCDVPA